MKAADIRKRFLLRASALTIVAATFVVAASLGATAIRAKGEARRTAVIAATPTRAAASDSVASSTPTVPAATISQAASNPAPADSVATGVPAPALQGASAAASVAQFAPIIAEGESPFADSVTAFRSDSVVTLSFDNTIWRTRNPEKFEEFVRNTLPAIYGHAVDSALKKLPWGFVAKQGNLLSELPTRGVRVPVSDAWSIRIMPETRPGQGGPLVVRYRASVIPATQ